ncbi:MAG TPA: adenylate/guanylate cyclase domain-containing protein [Nitrososphaeraceae archaeon]|nr:adenylate/guanylate cyclase domain-containing protein [Nitrososphaeraceae archaeon]
MTSGKYFNKGVKALDAPDIGHVVRETPDRIVVFGGGDERYDIPISEVQQVGANVLIGLRMYDIVTKYRVSRQELLPTSRQDPWTGRDRIDLATYEKEYPKSLFNKGVRAKNEDHVGHVMKETDDKIVIFGESNYRFDISKSKIIAAGRNVILDMDFPEIFKYQVDRNAPLPTGEPVEKINEEAYPFGDYTDKWPKQKQQQQDLNTESSLSRPHQQQRQHVQKREGEITESITDMIMGIDHSKNRLPTVIPGSQIVDTETLVSQTQDRMWKALKGHYRYDASLKDSQRFLFNYVNSKLSLVIMYADLVGSTNMTMTLPVDKMATIIRAFTFEMTSTVRSYGGYVLKYVGDAIIAFFPSGYNKLLACDKAVQCAKSMITVIKNGINPILNQADYPDLAVKIGVDEGENVIVQYGNDLSSLIDILGYSMSITAKITSLTKPNKITVGKDVYDVLHPEIRNKLVEVKQDTRSWKYTDRQTGELYKLYTLQGYSN